MWSWCLELVPVGKEEAKEGEGGGGQEDILKKRYASCVEILLLLN